MHPNEVVLVIRGEATGKPLPTRALRRLIGVVSRAQDEALAEQVQRQVLALQAVETVEVA